MNLGAATIKELRAVLDGGEVSSRELTEAYLEKINSENDSLGAYLEVLQKTALEMADLADEKIRSKNILPLTGIPLAIKDNILIDGARTTAASRILENYIAPYDATAVKRLKEQSAVFLGKTNLDEFAMGSSTENSAFLTTKNPHDNGRVPGGSSGGSAAAVAAGQCAGALGSDTGGSIRQPASFCGVVGFKPSYGRVSRYGLVAMASSLDQIGSLAKNSSDAALIFDAIAGRDRYDSTSIPSGRIPFLKSKYKNTHEWLEDFKEKEIVCGLIKECFGDGLGKGVEKNIRDAIGKIESAGIKVREISLPYLKYSLAVYYIIMPSEVSANLARFDGIKYGYSAITEDDKNGLEEIYLNSRHKGFGDEVRRRVMLGTYALSAGYYDAYYLKAQKARAAIIKDFNNTFEEIDFLLSPVTPSAAFKIGEKVDDPLKMYLSDIYTVPANLAGLPAISLPVGSDGGLPVGLQIIGSQFHDESLLQFCNFFEKLK